MKITEQPRIYITSDKDNCSKFELLLRYYQYNKNNIAAIACLFSLCRQMKRFDEIKRILEDYLEDFPDDDTIRYCLACVYIHCGEFRKSKIVLKNQMVNFINKETCPSVN